MKNYLITGVSLRSKGGVAMVVSAMKLLDSQNKYSLISYYPDYDSKVIFKYNLPLKLFSVSGKLSRNLMYKYEIFLMILDYLTHGVFRFSLFAKKLKNQNAVLEIHGISFSSNYGFNDALTSFLKIHISFYLKKKYIALPQSYGPNNSKIQRWLAKKSFEKMAFIFTRGKHSYEFVKSLSIRENFEFMPDLAFSFENPSHEEIEHIKERYKVNHEKKYIGILPNVLFIKWGLEKVVEVYKETILYFRKKGYNFIFLAHEYDDLEKDDRYFIKQLPIENEDIFPKNELSALEIKALLFHCDFSICSRFHGLISSLKMNIFPFVIGWADKYAELMELFDLQANVMHYCNVDAHKFISMIESSGKKKDFKSQIDEFSNKLSTLRKLIGD